MGTAFGAKGNQYPLPCRREPPKNVAKLFFERNKLLAERSEGIPKRFLDEVRRMHSNSQNMAPRLKSLGIQFPTDEVFREAYGPNFIYEPDALATLQKMLGLQIAAIYSGKPLTSGQAEYRSSAAALLFGAHDRIIQNRFMLEEYTNLKKNCAATTFSGVRVPDAWKSAKGAALYTGGVSAVVFGGMYALTNQPESVKLIVGAIAFVSSLSSSLRRAIKNFRHEKDALHSCLEDVSEQLRNLDELEERAFALLPKMRQIQESLSKVISGLEAFYQKSR
jgi:hypothetical protein